LRQVAFNEPMSVTLIVQSYAIMKKRNETSLDNVVTHRRKITTQNNVKQKD